MATIESKDDFEKIIESLLLILLVGNIGTGKSTISKYLMQKKSFHVLSGDKIGKEISNGMLLGHIYEKTTDFLCKGESVIIDGTNLKGKYRNLTASPALKRNIPVLIIDCGKGTEEDLNRRLIENRGIPKELWVKYFNYNQKEYEEPECWHKKIFIVKREIIYGFDDFYI